VEWNGQNQFCTKKRNAKQTKNKKKPPARLASTDSNARTRIGRAVEPSDVVAVGPKQAYSSKRERADQCWRRQAARKHSSAYQQLFATRIDAAHSQIGNVNGASDGGASGEVVGRHAGQRGLDAGSLAPAQQQRGIGGGQAGARRLDRAQAERQCAHGRLVVELQRIERRRLRLDAAGQHWQHVIDHQAERMRRWDHGPQLLQQVVVHAEPGNWHQQQSAQSQRVERFFVFFDKRAQFLLSAIVKKKKKKKKPPTQ
jgi:hypothetical protein